MDNFDLKKYLAEGKLSEGRSSITQGYIDPDNLPTEDNPLVLRNFTTKGLYTMVRVFAKSVAKIYGLNLNSAIGIIKEELDKLNKKEG
tara:strand:- start:243 stop:506 length:264 start_codon:yes stop_codon:yes gene_type:complete